MQASAYFVILDPKGPQLYAALVLHMRNMCITYLGLCKYSARTLVYAHTPKPHQNWQKVTLFANFGGVLGYMHKLMSWHCT